MLDELGFPQLGKFNVIALDAVWFYPLVGKGAISILALEAGFSTSLTIAVTFDEPRESQINTLKNKEESHLGDSLDYQGAFNDLIIALRG